MNRLIDAIEKDQFKTELPAFRVGDSVRVHTRVIEGDKERIQIFAGIVIGRKGRGLNETFPVRRLSHCEGGGRGVPGACAAHRANRSRKRRTRASSKAELSPYPQR